MSIGCLVIRIGQVVSCLHHFARRYALHRIKQFSARHVHIRVSQCVAQGQRGQRSDW